MEAAEKRKQESDNRGIQNMEKLRRQQQKQLEIDRRLEEAMRQNTAQPTLKVLQLYPTRTKEI